MTDDGRLEAERDVILGTQLEAEKDCEAVAPADECVESSGPQPDSLPLESESG